MKYLDRIIQEERIVQLLDSNDDVINQAISSVLTSTIHNNHKFVLENMDLFIDDTLQDTYDNIKHFSESSICNTLSEISEAVSDPFASNGLKLMILESYSPPYNDQVHTSIPQSPNSTGPNSVVGQVSARGIGSRIWGGIKASGSLARKTTNWGPTVGDSARYVGNGIKASGSLARKATNWGPTVGDSARYVGNDVSTNWNVGNATSSKKGIFAALIWPVIGSILAFSWFREANAVKIIKDPTSGQETLKNLTSGNSAEYLDELRERFKNAKEASTELIADASKGKIINQGEAIESKTELANIQKAAELLQSHKDVPSGTEGVINNIINGSSSQITKFDNSIDLFNKGEYDNAYKMMEIDPGWSTGTFLGISAIMAGLAYIGYVKYKDIIKAKLFERKLKKYIVQFSKLGFQEIHSINNTLLTKQKECLSTSKHIQKDPNDIVINISDSVRCYITYVSSLIISIATLHIAYIKSTNGNIRNIKSINDLIRTSDHRGASEVVKNLHGDYVKLLNSMIKDIKLKSAALDRVDNAISQLSNNTEKLSHSKTNSLKFKKQSFNKKR
jgi:hypothetical protein